MIVKIIIRKYVMYFERKKDGVVINCLGGLEKIF